MGMSIDKALYHITSQANKQSILVNGLTRGNHAFICLCKNPANWHGLVANPIIFKIDMQEYMKDYPYIRVTSWLPQSDEICVWGDIPKEYLKEVLEDGKID